MVVIIALLIWLVAIPLVHGVLPWAISWLAQHHGWTRGRPGIGNLIGLVPLVAGTACLFWAMIVGLARIPELPRTVKLELPPPFLMKSGPYAFSRNPMYVSYWALWLGWTLLYGSVSVFIGFLVLVAAVKFWVVPREERSLEARFGEAYLQYKRTVPRWLGVRQN
jgi:protein-S-isoprenylcysteine O-methyltransferase Ste14